MSPISSFHDRFFKLTKKIQTVNLKHPIHILGYVPTAVLKAGAICLILTDSEV